MESDEIKNYYIRTDQNRWDSSPFILGYEVKLSNNPALQHAICKQLAGVYPKWFKFSGWCEGCACYIVPVLPSKEEYSEYEKSILNGTDHKLKFPGIVKDVPLNFTRWVEENQYIENVPQFVKDNFTNGDITQGLVAHS
ncbi:hypothetical protein ACFS7Z_19780 [Pontibacter toksunensis]|uniref:Uncharacterized protein n=1 Tax=Pontibacter toksunensis TaxID=1332631 RepID=A0ABW6C078_9BACT